jgi:hypothetical protein
MYAIYAIFLTSKQFVSDYVNEKYYMLTDKFRYQFLRFVNPPSPTSLGKLCDGCTNSTYQMTKNALRESFSSLRERRYRVLA